MMSKPGDEASEIVDDVIYMPSAVARVPERLRTVTKTRKSAATRARIMDAASSLMVERGTYLGDKLALGLGKIRLVVLVKRERRLLALAARRRNAYARAAARRGNHPLFCRGPGARRLYNYRLILLYRLGFRHKRPYRQPAKASNDDYSENIFHTLHLYSICTSRLPMTEKVKVTARLE